MQLHITDILQSFDKYEVLTKTTYLAISSLKNELVAIFVLTKCSRQICFSRVRNPNKNMQAEK